MSETADVINNKLPTIQEQMQKMPTMTSGLVNPQPIPTNSSALRSSGQMRGPASSLSAAGQQMLAKNYQSNQTEQGASGGIYNYTARSNANIQEITQQSRDKMEQMKVPRKQGRMFQLDLGQNAGPFKQKEINGCPQVDKFATYSLNSIVNQKTSPRIGILGASTFPSENDYYMSGMSQLNQQQPGSLQQSKAMSQSQVGSQVFSGRIDDVSVSVNKQIKQLEDKLVTGYDMLQLFKEEADNIRKEIDVMMNILMEKAEVVNDEIHVEMRKDYKQLKADIKAQRDENEILYKNLKTVVQNTESQKRKITVYQAKIEELEQHVGILANSPDPHFQTSPMNAINTVTEENFGQSDIASGTGRANSNQIKVQGENQQHPIISAGLQSDNNIRGGSSMDHFKNKENNFQMQSNAVVNRDALSPQYVDNKKASIVTLDNNQNADLVVSENDNQM